MILYYIYVFGNLSKSIYKIGFCNKNKGSLRRMSEVQTGCPYKLELIHEFETKYGSKLEGAIHRRFELSKQCELDGENLNGEWFNLSKEDLDNFKEICKKTENNFDVIVENSTFADKNRLIQ